MSKDTSDKSAQRFFAAQQRRLDVESSASIRMVKLRAIRRAIAKKKEKEAAKRQVVSLTLEEVRAYKTALRLLFCSLSWAAALTITEDKDWRAKRLAKIAEASEIECDTVGHEQQTQDQAC